MVPTSRLQVCRLSQVSSFCAWSLAPSAAPAPDRQCFMGTNSQLSSDVISLQIEQGGPAVRFGSRADVLSSQPAPQPRGQPGRGGSEEGVGKGVTSQEQEGSVTCRLVSSFSLCNRMIKSSQRMEKDIF